MTKRTTNNLKINPKVYRFDLQKKAELEFHERMKAVELAFDDVVELRVDADGKAEYVYFSSSTIYGKFDTLEQCIATIEGKP